MSQSTKQEVASTVERLIEEVGSWPGVTVGDHRFGGTEWRVGPREIGHIHEWGMLDIAYLRRLRDVLVAAGETGVHHLLDQSGWTTYYIQDADDYDHARWLVRLSYLYHAGIVSKTPAGGELFAELDIDRELDALAPSETIRAAFERRGPEQARSEH